MILLLYVDDLFSFEFEMKELGMIHYLLGMEVWQNMDGIFLGQGKYAVEILKRCGTTRP